MLSKNSRCFWYLTSRCLRASSRSNVPLVSLLAGLGLDDAVLKFTVKELPCVVVPADACAAATEMMLFNSVGEGTLGDVVVLADD